MHNKPPSHKKNNQQALQRSVHLNQNLSFAKHTHEYNHQVTISPFPSASEIERLHLINPNFAINMMKLVEQQINADIENNKAKIELEKEEQKIRSAEVHGEIEVKRRGQRFGLISLIFLGILVVVLVWLQAYKTAGTIAAVVIVGAITAFTGFDGKNKNTKKEIQTGS